MSTLKEEYEIKKYLNKNKSLIEAKYLLDENSVIIEAIDAKKLTQIADAITKLDSLIAGVKAPALKTAIDTAVGDMQKFAAGKVNLNDLARIVGKDKAFNPITKSMTLFSAITKLFKTDLPAVLKTFRLGNDPNTDNVPISKIDNFENSLPTLQATLKKGLVGNNFLSFFGLGKLPYINNPDEIVNELLELTPAELMNISANVNKIPVPITNAEKNDVLALASGKVPPALATQQGNPTPQQPAQNGSQRIQNALNSLKGLPDNQIAQIVKGANTITDLIAKIEKTQPTNSTQPTSPTP